ncbi:MAG: hypothetical protein H0T85_04990 [Geodermatophilaceae bacterium]|nr:hypothetical protein [Geodermatophilaceae bacterium]
MRNSRSGRSGSTMAVAGVLALVVLLGLDVSALNNELSAAPAPGPTAIEDVTQPVGTPLR